MITRLFDYWKSKSMTDFFVVTVALTFIVYLIGKEIYNINLIIISKVIFAASVVLYFVHLNLHKLYIFTHDSKHAKKLPKREINRKNRLEITSFIIISSTILVLIKEISTGFFLTKLKNLLIYIARFIIQLFFDNAKINTGDIDPQYNFGFLNEVTGISRESGSELLSKIQLAIVIVGIIFTVSIIISFIKSSLKSGSKERISFDGDDENIDMYDRYRKKTMKDENKIAFFDFSLNSRIRRAYKRQILKKKRKMDKIPESYTAREIGEYVGVYGNSNYEDLEKVYEKSRYSKNGASEEDFKKLK